MKCMYYRLSLELVFPEGVSAGEESQGNRLTLARDGKGRFVLRGSALAGTLRHAWASHQNVDTNHEMVTCWFGYACNEDEGLASPFAVADCRLDIGSTDVVLRTHNTINRHTGSVMSGGLFEIESLPPGTTASATMTLKSDQEDTVSFLTWIAETLDGGITLGGRSARGIGRVKLQGTPRLLCCRPDDAEQLAAWLDDQYEISAGRTPKSGEPIEISGASGKRLTASLILSTPRGQDVLPGDGQGLDHELEPRRVLDAKGKERYCIPGSALKGIMRSWCSRLAAREGYTVADSAERHRQRTAQGEKLSGNDLAWGFVENPEEREHYQNDPDGVSCPIMKLFGSAYAAGRLHIADAFARNGASETPRMHVAIDRFSGGANEGMLFDNTVLSDAVFDVSLTLQNPTETEAAWLAKTIRAIDMGLLRVGSSKASGRLALAQSPQAVGPHADLLNSITPLEVA